jgi:hypothetical protein
MAAARLGVVREPIVRRRVRGVSCGDGDRPGSLRGMPPSTQVAVQFVEVGDEPDVSAAVGLDDEVAERRAGGDARRDVTDDGSRTW